MNRIPLGVICGLAFGILDIIPMIFMGFPLAAILGAFFNRLAIGFLICNVALPVPAWLTGLIVALLISLPDAIITEAYGPILGTAVVGGLIIGWIAGKYGKHTGEYVNT
jgi:hypothetical protein